MKTRLPALLCLSGLLLAGPGSAQTTMDFMPPGGKTLLLQIFGQVPGKPVLDELVKPRRSPEEWIAAIHVLDARVSGQQLRTLSAYLSVNMPVDGQAISDAVAAGSLGRALPTEGRELAWNDCQSCHSLFSGYLTQRLDVQGWQNKFQAPFHRELRMSQQERDEFSNYSAINMPMQIEDVPEELRF